MHELSIIHGLVSIAEETAERAGARRVKSIRFRLGALSGAVEDALLFSYEIAIKGTLLEGSQLLIQNLPVVIWCPSCRREVEIPGIQRFRCPVCDTPSAEIRQGRELEIESLEIEVADEHKDR